MRTDHYQYPGAALAQTGRQRFRHGALQVVERSLSSLRSMERNLVIREIGSLVVLRENTEPPHDFEWDAFLAVLERHAARLDKLKIFVRTPGGGPTPSQANRLRAILKNRPVLVAVVSESLFVRFLGSSIALLNRDLKMFSVDEMSAAWDHLKLSSRERALVEHHIDDMAFELYT